MPRTRWTRRLAKPMARDHSDCRRLETRLALNCSSGDGSFCHRAKSPDLARRKSISTERTISPAIPTPTVSRPLREVWTGFAGQVCGDRGTAKEEIRDKETRSRLSNALRRVDATLKTKVNRVGVLYAVLYWLFLPDDDSRSVWRMPQSIRACMSWLKLEGVHVKNGDFVPIDEYSEFAANREEWEVYEDTLHVDDTDPRSRALKAIHWIMLQGEGPAGGLRRHRLAFLQVSPYLRRAHESSGLGDSCPGSPAESVCSRQSQNRTRRPKAEAITHPETQLWAKLFNARYQMLLLDVLLRSPPAATVTPT